MNSEASARTLFGGHWSHKVSSRFFTYSDFNTRHVPHPPEISVTRLSARCPAADLVFVVARSGNCIGRYRSLKQAPEVRTQMQFFTLLVEQAARVSGSLQGVEQVRKPHKPHRMFEVMFAADVKSGPAGVGNRAVFFGKTLRQKRVANWTRKGYINDASSVQVPDLRTSETEFSASKP